MISREEIDEKTEEFNVHTSNVQRDYVFGWFLVGVYADPELAELLFLKGGNALRKGYFERTRYSADLDFGTERDIDQAFLEKKSLIGLKLGHYVLRCCRATASDMAIKMRLRSVGRQPA